MLKLGILTGGNSIEKEVSLKSCENVLQSINKDKYDITVYNVDENDNKWKDDIISNPPDIVFSTLHGGRGENGSMQGFLHYLGIPFVGSKVLSSSVCMDKHIAKIIMNADHISTVRDVYIQRNENIAHFKGSLDRLGYPLIIKPNRGGSSIGIKICHNYDDIITGARVIVDNYDDDILVEKYIKGREIACCVLETKEDKKCCIIDIDQKGDIFDYKDKYENQKTIEATDIPQYMQSMIKAIAIKSFDALKCKGYAMVDMIIKEEQIYVIEVNTLPGLTHTSLVPKASELFGMSFGEFIDKLIEFELEK